MPTVEHGRCHLTSSRDIEAALEISPLIYDAVLSPDRWPRVLERLGAELDASVVALNIMRPSTLTVFAAYQWGESDETMERYLALKDLGADDPRSAPGLEVVNRPATRRELVGDGAWYGSPIYRRVLEPLGLDDNIGVAIFDEPEDIGIAVAAFRKRGAPPLSRVERERLQLYVPHLRQAGRLVRQRYEETVATAALTRALDRVDLATVVVDRFGAVAFANTSGRAILSEADGVRDDDGRLVATDGAASEELAGAIFRMATVPARSDTWANAHLVLPRGKDRRPLHATVSPLAPSPDEARDGAVLLWAAVYLVDPERAYETTTEQLQRIFGLTHAEAEVMHAFVSGLEPRAIAGETGRAYETVRVHLKRVMEKAGVSRQTELMRLARSVLVPLRR